MLFVQVMPFYEYDSIVGDFCFDKNFNPIRRPKQKKANFLVPDKQKESSILESLKDRSLRQAFIQKNIERSVRDISKAMTDDVFAIQMSAAVDDIQRALNILQTRVREWLGYSMPELTHKMETSVLIRSVVSKSLNQVIKENHLDPLMMSPQPKLSEQGAIELMKQADALQELLSYEQKNLEQVTVKVVPNVSAICGPALAAKLLRLAGSIERLSKMPASTIQVLGAETALFRHLRSKAKPPKHGVLHEHALVAKVSMQEKGKAARDIAGKICIAAKVDYFKGKFIGDKLVGKLQKRFGRW